MKRFANPTTLLLIGAFVVFNLLNGGMSNPRMWVINMVEMIPGIVIGLSFHEFAHAFAAFKLGDPTPKMMGRVTINPAAHIDPIGMIALFFAGFGWGVPVQINPSNFKYPRRDEFIVAISGVMMNLLIAILFTFILKWTVSAGVYGSAASEIVMDIIIQVIVINLVLMIFNLLPIPPLDGFGIITEIFNLRGTAFYKAVYDKGFLILLILIIFNITDYVLTPAVQGMWTILLNSIVY